MSFLIFIKKIILFSWQKFEYLCYTIFSIFLFSIFFPLYFFLAIISRFTKKDKVGFGPEPLINNVHHKKALSLYGIKTETFVNHIYWLSDDFDIIIKRSLSYIYFIYCLFSYKAIFFYFNGGLLSFAYPNNIFLKKTEPLLLKVAGIKIIMIPYGGDVQNFNAHNDVVYKYAYITDYPTFVKKQMKYIENRVKLWTKYAHWIIAGCDWVNYLPYWDTLMLAHFSVDNNKWFPIETIIPDKFDKTRPLRILHAPNHKAIKGTDFIEKTIAELQAENYPIEYSLVQKVPNDKLVSIVQNADIVIDQLIIGWYGIFALEAMSCKKPVFIYINPELERMYIMAGLLELNELPCVKSDHNTLKTNIINMIDNPSQIGEIGTKSYDFVNKHHSLEYVGKVFSDILDKLGCLN